MTASTKGIIGKKELKLVKPTVRFINAARGGIIDEEALYEAIEAGRPLCHSLQSRLQTRLRSCCRSR